MAEKLTFKNDTYGFLNDLNKNRINIEKLKKNGNFELYYDKDYLGIAKNSGKEMSLKIASINMNFKAWKNILKTLQEEFKKNKIKIKIEYC